MRFFLITTEHSCDKIWFKDDEDFKAAMNFVAVLAHVTSVYVIAFILMSNHIHLVLQCDRKEAFDFIGRFKSLYGKYYCRKYDCSSFFNRNSIDMREVRIEDESLHRAIAYVQMNSVAAGICINPSGYRWGTGDCFFRERPGNGEKIGRLKRRAQIRLIHSNVKVNQDWTVSDGYILPESYVTVRFVQELYRKPARMEYFLRTSSKVRAVLESGITSPNFRDQLVQASISDICTSLFRTSRLEDLNHAQTCELLRQLRRRFSCDVNQLQRVTGIPYEKVSSMLEEFS